VESDIYANFASVYLSLRLVLLVGVPVGSSLLLVVIALGLEMRGLEGMATTVGESRVFVCWFQGEFRAYNK
jgi:hypothetical protein